MQFENNAVITRNLNGFVKNKCRQIKISLCFDWVTSSTDYGNAIDKINLDIN